MAAEFPGFHEFEHAGWEDADVVASYEREVVEVTRQSEGALLAAGRVAPRARVLDVACGPGFLAAAAALNGAANPSRVARGPWSLAGVSLAWLACVGGVARGDVGRGLSRALPRRVSSRRSPRYRVTASRVVVSLAAGVARGPCRSPPHPRYGG